MSTKEQAGFTLVEMMIVVVIAAILAALAAPNMSEFLQNSARTTRINSMVTAINVARSTAVAQNTTVSLCQSTTPFAACTSPATGVFENGWIVFSDTGVVGTVDGTDAVLRVFQPDMAGSATLRGTDMAGATIGLLSYRRNGFPDTAGFFTYCDDRDAAEARAVVVSVTGHASISRDGTDAGTVHDVNGNDLTCP